MVIPLRHYFEPMPCLLSVARRHKQPPKNIPPSHLRVQNFVSLFFYYEPAGEKTTVRRGRRSPAGINNCDFSWFRKVGSALYSQIQTVSFVVEKKTVEKAVFSLTYFLREKAYENIPQFIFKNSPHAAPRIEDLRAVGLFFHGLCVACCKAGRPNTALKSTFNQQRWPWESAAHVAPSKSRSHSSRHSNKPILGNENKKFTTGFFTDTPCTSPTSS